MSAPQKPSSNAKVPNPQLLDLQKPEKLSSVLKKDEDDCLSCRLTGKGYLHMERSKIKLIGAPGSAAFFGLGAYVYVSGRNALNERGAEIVKRGARVGIRGRMAGLGVLSSSLAGLGIYRLVN